MARIEDGWARDMMSRRRFLEYSLRSGAALGLSGLAATLAACQQTPPAATPAKAGVPKVADEFTVQLNWVFNVQFGGFWAANEKGFFAEHGVKPTFQPGGPGVQPESIVAGGGPLLGLSAAAPTFIKSILAGSKLKAIGAIYQKAPSGLMSLPEKPVRTVKDAIGKRIGLQPGARSTWTAALKKAGVSMDQMEIVNVGVDPTPLVAGQVDAYWCFVINQPIALKEKGIETVVVMQEDLLVPGYSNYFVATESALQKDRDKIVRFLRAARKGWEYNNANPDEIAKLTVEKVSPDLKLSLSEQTKQNQAQVPLTQSALTQQKGLFWMDAARWEEVVKVLVDVGELEKSIPVDQIMTLDILKEAFG